MAAATAPAPKEWLYIFISNDYTKQYPEQTSVGKNSAGRDIYYAGLSPLDEITDKDEEHIDKIFSGKDKYKKLKNFSKDELLRELHSLATFYAPTNVMLIYSGHGFHDYKNMMAGIYTMDVIENSLGYHDIIRMFKQSTNFYLIHGACRSHAKAISVNYDLLIREFHYFFSIYGVARGTAQLGDRTLGSWMINAFYDRFKEERCSSIDDHDRIILCLIAVAEGYNKFIRDTRDRIERSLIEGESINYLTAKVEVNHNVREAYPIITTITGQSEESISATKIDVRARRNIRVRELRRESEELREEEKRRLRREAEEIRLREERRLREENIRERKIRELKCIQKLLKIRLQLKEVEQDKSNYDMKINDLRIRRSRTKDEDERRRLIENEIRLRDLNITIVTLRNALRRKIVDQEQRCRDL